MGLKLDQNNNISSLQNELWCYTTDLPFMGPPKLKIKIKISSRPLSRHKQHIEGKYHWGLTDNL